MMRIHLDIDSPMIMMMMTMMTLMTIMLMPSQSVQSVPLYQWILLQPPFQHLQSSVETIARSQKFSIYYILRSQNHSAQHHTQLRPVFWVSLHPVSIIVYCLPSVLYHCVSPWKYSVSLYHCVLPWKRCSVTSRMVSCVLSSQSFVNEELLVWKSQDLSASFYIGLFCCSVYPWEFSVDLIFVVNICRISCVKIESST